MDTYLRLFSLVTTTLFLALPFPVNILNSSNSLLLAQTQVAQGSKIEADQIQEQGLEYYKAGRFEAAVKSWQEALSIYRSLDDSSAEAITLYLIGSAYEKMNDYHRALEFYQQALAIFQVLNDRPNMGETLASIGDAYYSLGLYDKSLDFLQQALIIYQETNDAVAQGKTLNNIGLAYDALGEYSKAIAFYEQALAVYQGNGDQFKQAVTLSNLGAVHKALGQDASAESSYRQALDIFLELGTQITEEVTPKLGETHPAREFYWQALEIAKQMGNRQAEGNILIHLGEIHQQTGLVSRAKETYNKARRAYGAINDRAGEGDSLNHLGSVEVSLGNHTQALNLYQEALNIFQNLNNRGGEGITLKNIGSLYFDQKQYPQAIDFYQQALVIEREINNSSEQGNILNHLGDIYRRQNDYQQAESFYQQALAIRRSISDRSGESTTLNRLGGISHLLGNYDQALKFYQQALDIAKTRGDLIGQASLLQNIGLSYGRLEDYPQTIEFLQQASLIYKQLGYRALEAETLSNIGYVLAQQNKTELAIVFYKQAINILEEVRQDLTILPLESQQTFPRTFANTYRNLADLLLQQDRVSEAQQVLDLLKVQELDDYLQNVRGNQQTAQGVEDLPSEQQILQQYIPLQDQAIQIGKELLALRRIPKSQQTSIQQQRIAELDGQQQKVIQQFTEFTRRPDIAALAQQLKQTSRNETIGLTRLQSLTDDLQQLEQNAVLLYPLILEDRIELVLVTPYSPPIRRTIPVKQEDLHKTILRFRQTITNYRSNSTEQARQLYNWLIKPIEKDLAAAEAQTIIYAPDGQLRYIPFAALHDGQGWLAERFRINHITAASLTNLNIQPQTQLKILAGAFTQGNYSFQASQRQFSFSGLPFAGVEVENLAATIPDTTQLIDDAFSKSATIPRMKDYSVIHFATHATFLPGSPYDSFILFGNGDRANLREVQDTWSLANVDLVVLSACQTALGGILGKGEEILGFGYLMQNAGAKAAIASLWSVDDGGTQTLMSIFYEKYKTGNLTKVEALNQAQIAMIEDDISVLGKSKGLTHPYYWAPFILIGNGL